MDLLFKSFEENSIGWVFLSAILGGIIGASTKLIFENVFPFHLAQSRLAYQTLERLKFPLMQAADTLDRRLENLICNIDENWYLHSEDDYYRISTLYLFANFFSWCKILEQEAFLRYEFSDRSAREFSISFYSVFKGMTSFSYFRDFDDSVKLKVQQATVPRLVLTAIGELMHEKRSDDATPVPFGIVEFKRQLTQQDEEFSYWFRHLDRFLKSLKHSSDDMYWNRLVIFAINLRLLLAFLDRKNRVSKPRKVIYLKCLHKDVEYRITQELQRRNLMHLVDDDNKIVAPERLCENP